MRQGMEGRRVETACGGSECLGAGVAEEDAGAEAGGILRSWSVEDTERPLTGVEASSLEGLSSSSGAETMPFTGSVDEGFTPVRRIWTACKVGENEPLEEADYSPVEHGVLASKQPQLSSG